MINPSASGWIDKFFTLAKKKLPVDAVSPDGFYATLRGTGFIYGYVTGFDSIDKKEMKGWDSEETTKAALLVTLYELYRLMTGKEDSSEFIDKALAFYSEMTPEGFRFLKKVLPASRKSHELESVLNERVQTNENIISKTFSHILTNALLFMDVLAFMHYLRNDAIPAKYLRKLEETTLSLVSLALKIKTTKSDYDDLLIKLFESSVRYTKFSRVKTNELSKLDLDNFDSDLEKNYLLDMACMAIWNDGRAEENEIDFLYDLAKQLGLEDAVAAESIASFDVFIKLHKKDIPYFRYSNPVMHFYGNASQNVKQLITRNKKRLVKELSNNGELMLLLTHSTHRILDAKEKKKVKKQLLEMCKTIPSLTIFILPGGSLLLPLLIKFIPQLLPSVFNENLDNNE
ncbi:MAG: hypothetical protein EOO45_07535 [Flavobacterium sp.]|nr:MAG: hypothetical protein EOO45_07535 [Flavobacterium sp.]